VEHHRDKGRARPRGETAVSRAEHIYQFEKMSTGLLRSQLLLKIQAARPMAAERLASGAEIIQQDKCSQAVCREATRRMKRPSGNRTAFSFKGE
jgi:hypothetical protein